MAAELLGITYDDSAGIVWNDADRTKTRVFSDIYKVSAVTADEAYGLGSLPRIGNAHPTNFLARVTSRQARFSDVDARASVAAGTGVYNIEVQYTTNSSVQDGEEDDTTEPWDLEPEWWWDNDTIDVVVLQDAIDDSDIENSAGDRINVTWPIPIPILHIERYELTFDPDVILDYVCHTNSAVFWGAPADAALMTGIRPRRESVNGVKLWRVHYEIKFRIDGQYGWIGRFLDEGYNYLDAGVKKRSIDAAGNPIKVNLDGSGGILAIGSPKNYITKYLAPRADFNNLQLGPF